MLNPVRILSPLLIVGLLGAAVPTPRPSMPRAPQPRGIYVPKPNPPPLCPDPKRTGCQRWMAEHSEILLASLARLSI